MIFTDDALAAFAGRRIDGDQGDPRSGICDAIK